MWPDENPYVAMLDFPSGQSQGSIRPGIRYDVRYHIFDAMYA